MNGCFTVSFNMATILSEMSFPRSHKKCIFVLKTESRCQLNILSRNISVDTAPITIALGKCLVSLAHVFSPSFPFPSVTLWLLYGTSQVICASQNLLKSLPHALSDKGCAEQSDSAEQALGAGLAFTTKL